MEKIPKAEEVIDKMVKFASANDTINCTVYSLSQVMIEFAKMHVEAALKAASENVDYTTDGQEHITHVWIDKDSILNSYSLDNIK